MNTFKEPQKINYIQSKMTNKQKKKVMEMDLVSKLKYIDELIISYKEINDIMACMKECMESTKHSSQPECMTILGPPRAGKTTTVNRFMSNYPTIETIEGTIKPVLYCEVPCPATIRGLASSLLKALGDPFFNKSDTITSKTHRLDQLLIKCGVKLIILDEVQHLIDSNRRKLIRDSSDWFKGRISITRIPVIFVGLEHSEQIFFENEQLSSRVLNRFRIKPFNANDKTFRVLLHIFDINLPFVILSNLADDGLSELIYRASQGYLGYLKILLKEASRIALIDEEKCIRLNHLKMAYDKKLAVLNERNPFD